MTNLASPDQRIIYEVDTKRRANHASGSFNRKFNWHYSLTLDLKNVRATLTQPGVMVLEGEVLDNEAKALAEQTVAALSGVKRVINALTTNSLQWLLVQNRINQALQQNGFPLVSVKVIVKTASISGQVSTEADKDRAVTVVNATAPDVTIGANLINVVSSGL